MFETNKVCLGTKFVCILRSGFQNNRGITTFLVSDIFIREYAKEFATKLLAQNLIKHLFYHGNFLQKMFTGKFFRGQKSLKRILFFDILSKVVYLWWIRNTASPMNNFSNIVNIWLHWLSVDLITSSTICPPPYRTTLLFIVLHLYHPTIIPPKCQSLIFTVNHQYWPKKRFQECTLKLGL